MQGGIALTIGLVLAANARLRGLTSKNWPDGSIYAFCNKIDFTGRKLPGFLGFGRSRIIDDPEAWLHSIPTGTKKAQLNHLIRGDPNISDRDSVGFANGGPVFLAQLVGPINESWYGEWNVTEEDAANRRIWSVSYRNYPELTVELSIPGGDHIRSNLLLAIEDTLAFARRKNLGFEDSFTSALAASESKNPLADYHLADAFSDGLVTLGNQQLFACAAKAWVFGGMGSWNDIWFEGDDAETYREVSDRLFASIIAGLVVATNSSAPNAA